MQIRFPWEIRDSSWDWAVLAITRRGFPEDVWKKPQSPAVIKQIEFLVLQLRSLRNFVVCFCAYPNYMRDLYFFVASTWMCSTTSTADVFTAERVREAASSFDVDRFDTLENTDLLILSYTDPDNMNLKYIRESLGRIFERRRIAKKPTIIDIGMLPSDKKTKAGIHAMFIRIRQLYGEKVLSSFGSENTKYVLVNVGGYENER